MHPLNWSVAETTSVVGAIKFICTEAGTIPLKPLHEAFLEGFRDHIFRHHEIDVAAIAPIGPAAFAAQVRDKEHRDRALEYLTLAPYIQVELPDTQADLVKAFFRSVGANSDALSFLQHLAHHHILMGQLCVGRKLLPHLLPGGPIKQISRAFHMLKESRGDARTAAEYAKLADLPAGTLGNAFHRFHRNRGFALPGEPGCIPEEVSALHDLTHILSGYNTHSLGEIVVQAFAGGTMEKHGMMIAVTGLLSFHNALLFDAGGHLPLHKGNLEPHAFAEAFARGMRSDYFLEGWDFKADWALPVAAVREKFHITGAADVWDDPPPDQRPAAARV